MEGERTVSRRRILKSGAAIGGGIGTLSLLAGTAGAQPEEYVVTQIYRPNGLSTDLEGAECTVSSNDSTSRRWCRFYTDQYIPVTIDVSGGGGIDDTAVRSRAVRFWSDERVDQLSLGRGDSFVVTEDRGDCCCNLGTYPDFRTVHIEL
ncbi:hypothetical protein HAPAU_21890 [Halalkalicoccus paucihalophilus]|uniref:Uncharacterized protein n=1 Tax=Halalkalicoccus paucihalophilus TaxID=1008153 RepID=A0A151ACZ1_9EURY|nr:hypothetical protein [Halalkalicoccus paucihalophilus]KYH25515.1 hypothetical protein HAPAU_21890 [Halalkalicoccus paucihalophilus]